MKESGCPIRDSASRPGLVLITPPSRQSEFQTEPGNRTNYLLGQFKSLHHNNSCTLIPLIARNLAGWTFVCPRRNLLHPASENNNALVLRYSADPLKAVSGLRLVLYPQAILKIHPPSSLDYRARHETLVLKCIHFKLLLTLRTKITYLNLLLFHCDIVKRT